MKVVVIIPAAGLGTRMAPLSSAKDTKPHLSKQFTELAGTPILIHTLRRFAAVDEVTEIWIALRENEIEVTAVHSHMLAEQPRLFFMHFWANDQAIKLANGLRAALDQIALAKD